MPNIENLSINILVNNLKKDEIFKRQLNKYATSNDIKLIKKEKNIQKALLNIKVEKINGEYAISTKYIGILMDISNIKSLVKDFDTDEIRIKIVNDKQKIYLTEEGIMHAVYLTRSKSPFVKIMRKFLSNIVKYVFRNEMDILQKVGAQTLKENPELVQETIDYLKEKNIYDRLLREKEKQIHELQDENNKLGLEKSYSAMIIKDLKIQKDKIIAKVDDHIQSKIDCVSITELDILKKKYMKCLQLYLVTPEYLQMYSKNKKSDMGNVLTDLDEYKKEYSKIDSLYIPTIFSKEILYYTFKTDKKKYKGLEFICDIYVLKQPEHYKMIINEIQKISINEKINKSLVFKISLNALQSIVHNKFVKLEEKPKK